VLDRAKVANLAESACRRRHNGLIPSVEELDKGGNCCVNAVLAGQFRSPLANLNFGTSKILNYAFHRISLSEEPFHRQPPLDESDECSKSFPSLGTWTGCVGQLLLHLREVMHGDAMAAATEESPDALAR
jgi:hypothetical protein